MVLLLFLLLLLLFLFGFFFFFFFGGGGGVGGGDFQEKRVILRQGEGPGPICMKSKYVPYVSYLLNGDDNWGSGVGGWQLEGWGGGWGAIYFIHPRGELKLSFDLLH